MDGMSDTRNEIEQRLGVFARQGEKATFAGIDDAPWIQENADAASKDINKWFNEKKRMIASAQKSINRVKVKTPEQKAKLDAANQVFAEINSLMSELLFKEPQPPWNETVAGYTRYGDQLEKFLAKLKTKVDPQIQKKIEAALKLAKFARPGAKVEFGNVDRLGGLLEAAYQASRRNNEAEVKRLLNEAKKEIDSSTPAHMIRDYRDLKASMSRPGAKAIMDKSAALAIVGKAIESVPAGPQRDALQKALIDYYDNTQASNRLLKQGKLTDATRFDVEAGRAVQIAVRVWDRMGKPAAELRGFTQNLERAAEFSRPGAKATMGILDRISRGLSAATAKPVDPTTPQYLSGLTAAKKAAEEAKSNYEYMADLNDARFKQLDNYVKVTSNMITKMNSSADIQRLIAGLKAAVAARVFVQSSMKTPFSRPGSNQTFAYYDDPKLERELRQASKMLDTIEEQINSNKRDLAIANYNKVKRLITQEGNDKDFRRLMALERRLKSMSSRPGAKAANALSDACWQGYEAVGTKEQDGKTVPNCVPKATAAKPDDKTECADCETEQDKAGLKLMEKADKAVSDKIRTLIKEGKPQEQAVAIALDMKRRGEL